MNLQDLVDRLIASGVVQDVEADESFVFGTSHFPADDSDIVVNIDPEFEENDEVDLDALVSQVGRILEIRAGDWKALVDEIAEEITEAVVEADLARPRGLRKDMQLDSLVVLSDAYLVAFAAPTAFPDGMIRVQLDLDFEIQDLAVELDSDDPALEGLED